MSSLPPVTLDADPFWSSFADYNGYGDFEAVADRMAFRADVPADVVDHFGPTRRLVLLSYTHADLLDVALERALFGFELALKHRHREVVGRDWKGNLAGLIDWAGCRDMFEDGAVAAHTLRELRNRAAHPSPDQLVRLRYLALEALLTIPRLINGTYDDTALRAARTAERDRLNEHLLEVTEEGAVADLRALGLSSHIVFLAEAVHVENRLDELDPTYYVAVWPIFDPGDDPDDRMDLGEPVVVRSSGWELTEGAGVTLTGRGPGDVVLSPMSDPVHRALMGEWRAGVGQAQGGEGLVRALTQYRLATLRLRLREYGADEG